MTINTFALATLGCKVNQYESAIIKSQLADLENVRFGEPADLYIVNTCGVTAEAEAKARQLINRARRAAPYATLVLTGCWPKAETNRFRALGVDLFFDNPSKGELVNQLPLKTAARDASFLALKTTGERTRAFIKVQDGCDESCSYCAVPTFRDRLISRSMDAVIAEIDGLVESGVSEVVLSGINLGKYGADLKNKPALPKLIADISTKTDIKRVRLSSIEPLEISAGFIDFFSSSPTLARHLHIPLQSGSDKILAAMNRRYTAKDFFDLANKLRERLPGIALTTDIIVGFPGESTEDFAATLEMVKAVSFTRLHVFKFSTRPGTPAAEMAGQVEPELKKERAAIAKALGVELSARFTAGFIDKQVSVVTEREKNGFTLGLTSEYVRVRFKQALIPTGDLINAMGISAEADLLTVRSEND